MNDTLGHSTGDQLLVEVGHRLIGIAEVRAEVGLVCRLGGDEFVVVIPDCGDPRVVSEIVEAMLMRSRSRSPSTTMSCTSAAAPASRLRPTTAPTSTS